MCSAPNFCGRALAAGEVAGFCVCTAMPVAVMVVPRDSKVGVCVTRSAWPDLVRQVLDNHLSDLSDCPGGRVRRAWALGRWKRLAERRLARVHDEAVCEIMVQRFVAGCEAACALWMMENYVAYFIRWTANYQALAVFDRVVSASRQRGGDLQRQLRVLVMSHENNRRSASKVKEERDEDDVTSKALLWFMESVISTEWAPAITKLIGRAKALGTAALAETLLRCMCVDDAGAGTAVARGTSFSAALREMSTVIMKEFLGEFSARGLGKTLFYKGTPQQWSKIGRISKRINEILPIAHSLVVYRFGLCNNWAIVPPSWVPNEDLQSECTLHMSYAYLAAQVDPSSLAGRVLEPRDVLRREVVAGTDETLSGLPNFSALVQVMHFSLWTMLVSVVQKSLRCEVQMATAIATDRIVPVPLLCDWLRHVYVAAGKRYGQLNVIGEKAAIQLNASNRCTSCGTITNVVLPGQVTQGVPTFSDGISYSVICTPCVLSWNFAPEGDPANESGMSALRSVCEKELCHWIYGRYPWGTDIGFLPDPSADAMANARRLGSVARRNINRDGLNFSFTAGEKSCFCVGAPTFVCCYVWLAFQRFDTEETRGFSRVRFWVENINENARRMTMSPAAGRTPPTPISHTGLKVGLLPADGPHWRIETLSGASQFLSEVGQLTLNPKIPELLEDVDLDAVPLKTYAYNFNVSCTLVVRVVEVDDPKLDSGLLKVNEMATLLYYLFGGDPTRVVVNSAVVIGEMSQYMVQTPLRFTNGIRPSVFVPQMAVTEQLLCPVGADIMARMAMTISQTNCPALCYEEYGPIEISACGIAMRSAARKRSPPFTLTTAPLSVLFSTGRDGVVSTLIAAGVIGDNPKTSIIMRHLRSSHREKGGITLSELA